jgi:zinc transport system ATP-binding protein
LSGGQQQRVLLARALTASKKLLLLDEPGAGLDPVVTQGLYALLEQINKEMGVTIIMVSHDMQTSVKYAGKILHLNIVQKFFGKTSDYTRSEIGKYWTGGLSHD